MSEKENKNSAAKIAANNKYNAKAYDRINLAVKKGMKDMIKAHAETFGDDSVNAFVVRAINEAIERDNAIIAETAPDTTKPTE